jgi:hypothetical protein
MINLYLIVSVILFDQKKAKTPLFINEASMLFLLSSLYVVLFNVKLQLVSCICITATFTKKYLNCKFFYKYTFKASLYLGFMPWNDDSCSYSLRQLEPYRDSIVFPIPRTLNNPLGAWHFYMNLAEIYIKIWLVGYALPSN